MSYDWKYKLDCDEVVELLTGGLEARGFSVLRSFDLRSARASLRDPQNCSCPHHGTAQCACQYVVILARTLQDQPISIIVHGHEDETMVSLGRSPQGESNNQTSDILMDIVADLVS
jgi:hypothetical protein